MSETIDVATVVLGLDAAVRARVQARMKELAESGDTKTSGGLVVLLRQAIGVLRESAPHVTHVATESTRPLAPAAARQRFVEATHRARSRFSVEVIRNADGQTTRAEPGALSASGEPGVVLVTLAVARRTEIPDVAPYPDRPALDALLVELAATSPSDLVAMEVVWSPAAEADRVSVAELERRHPEIRRLA